MESAFKVKADGWLVKKIIALVWKWARAKGVGWVREGGGGGVRARQAHGGWVRGRGAAVSMMGSDSGLSRGSGCPEKCEAGAMRWQERAGCQSKKVALKRQKGKESACQAPLNPGSAAVARSGYGAETKVERGGNEDGGAA